MKLTAGVPITSVMFAPVTGHFAHVEQPGGGCPNARVAATRSTSGQVLWQWKLVVACFGGIYVGQLSTPGAYNVRREDNGCVRACKCLDGAGAHVRGRPASGFIEHADTLILAYPVGIVQV